MPVLHALKTALAAGLTLLVYPWLPFTSGTHAAWAVAASVIVMQSNLGGSWKTSSQRLIGTAIGAAVGATGARLIGTPGHDPASVLGLASAVGATALICGLTGLRESVRLGATTTGIVMLMPDPAGPWATGLARFLDTAVGIAVALMVQSRLWPSRAADELRDTLAAMCARQLDWLLAAVALARAETRNPEPLNHARTEARSLARTVRDLLEDFAREPVRPRQADSLLTAWAGEVLAVHDALLALDQSARQVQPQAGLDRLDPELATLIERTRAALERWTDPQSHRKTPPPDIAGAIAELDTAYDRLRATGALRILPPDQLLSFSGFIGSVRAVARAVSRVGSHKAPAKTGE